jgi:hypothetical protein
MGTHSPVFVSDTTAGFKSHRQAVKDVLLTDGILRIEQEHF